MKEKNMLVRAVPLDVWERVEKFCRQKNLKRRDFIELALTLFEGEDGERAEAASRKAMADLRDIQSYVKAVRNAIKLKKDINQIRDDIKVFRDEDVEMNLLVELKQKEDDLDHILRIVMPKHEIPDDPEERRKMGLPKEYQEDWVDIPNDSVRSGGPSSSPGWEPDPNRQVDADLKKKAQKIGEDAFRKMEEMERKNEERNPSDQPNQDNDSPEMTRENAEGQARIPEELKTRIEKIRKGFKDSVQTKDENAEGKKIETRTFGRGFDDQDDE